MEIIEYDSMVSTLDSENVRGIGFCFGTGDGRGSIHRYRVGNKYGTGVGYGKEYGSGIGTGSGFGNGFGSGDGTGTETGRGHGR